MDNTIILTGPGRIQRYGAGIEKINIQCRMKTRRNKGRKGRNTYKTRHGGLINKNKFLEVLAETQNEIRDNTKKRNLLNKLRSQDFLEEEEKNTYPIINNIDEEESVEKRRNANTLKQKRQQRQQIREKKHIIKIREIINNIKRDNPNEFSKSESTYNELTPFTKYKDTSFDNFLIMFNNIQIEDIYNNKFDTKDMILFYLDYFIGKYHKKHGTIIDTYREYVIVSK